MRVNLFIFKVKIKIKKDRPFRFFKIICSYLLNCFIIDSCYFNFLFTFTVFTYLLEMNYKYKSIMLL